MSNGQTLADVLAGIDINHELSTLNDMMFQRTFPPVESTRVRIPRKPKKGCEIVASSWRPHVLASDRLHQWFTPQTKAFHDSIAGALPETTLRKLFEVMVYSLDQSTRDGYGAGLLRFTQFCDKAGVSEEDRMPASSVLLSGFAADAAGKVASTTVDNWFAGIHFWHTINGAAWNGDVMLQQVRKGVKKLVPISSKRAKRPPVTIEHMYTLRAGLDLTNAFDAAVWAVACVAFWSCCRLGELTVPSVNLFDIQKHVSRSATISEGCTGTNVRFNTFHIPWTKTTGVEGADISVTSRDDPSCPFEALAHHRHCSADLPAGAPLFAFETEGGGWAPMVKGWFMERCNEIWVAAGLPDMPGHGFRIGGATQLLLLGVPPDIVQTQGRWLSRAFLAYWRRIESILPLFISRAGASRVNLVEEAMEGYRVRCQLK